MTHHHESGDREFTIPFGRLPEWSYQCSGELYLRVAGPEGRPAAIELRFWPSNAEFQLRLPKLHAEGGFSRSTALFSLDAQGRQAVVIYEGSVALLARMPSGLADLEAFETSVNEAATVFAPTDYQLTGFKFEVPETAGV